MPDGKTLTPPTVKNWITTLQGFIDLYGNTKAYGFTTMSPRTFNQDPLENFFGKIRQRGVRFTNPTVGAFTPSYKSLLVNNFNKSHWRGSNCENYEGDILISLKRFVTQNEQDQVQQLYVNSDIKVPKKFKKLKYLEAFVLYYVSGFVSKKVLPNVENCDICKQDILFNEQKENSVHETLTAFTKYKEYNN